MEDFPHAGEIRFFADDDDDGAAVEAYGNQGHTLRFEDLHVFEITVAKDACGDYGKKKGKGYKKQGGFYVLLLAIYEEARSNILIPTMVFAKKNGNTPGICLVSAARRCTECAE